MISPNGLQCTFGPLLPAASALANRFLKAAQLLLRAETSSANAMNVAALMVLTISATCFGKDKISKQFMCLGIRMAEQLHLVGEYRYDATQFGDVSGDELSMLEHAAWGAFNLSA